MSNTRRFEGQTIIVTGAGSGIGRATALRLSAEGATVVATDLIAERLEALEAELPGGDLRWVAGDASDETTIASVVVAADGRIDGLANVAGVVDRFQPIHELDDSVWEKVFAVNLTAVVRMSRGVLPVMMRAGSGSIVNVASEAGLRGSIAGVAYTASKHAVVGVTKHASFMYAGSGIRVNAVAPGGVLTNIEATSGSEFASNRMELTRSMVTPRVGPEAIAAAVTWLLSPDSDNVSGVILPSDGGWSAI